ncbi:MAG: hypothetical protein EA359_01650 [Balneolaceae bacterium]|nr:MAG: hypothetical protein EA359_01650 [Balneolaceae bacterium]
MSGEKISTGITCVHCSGSQPYEQRTTYSFNVEWTADSPDRIRFFGLEGADAGASRYRVFPGCTHPDNCEVYGKIIGLEEFEIDIEHEGRRFRANGVFRTVSVELSGQFTFDDITITYDLSGNRVDF